LRGMVMIYKSFASIAALILLSGVAHAGSAPKELYGKSITVAWTETRIQRAETDQGVHNFGWAGQMNIYISTAGRSFVRTVQSGTGGYSSREARGIGHPISEISPDKPISALNERADFEGRSIVVYKQFPSGVRRIAIDLGDAGTGCKATVINGRESGKSAVRNSGRGKVELSSIQVGTVSCSIREGNVFGH
jgi:hypothetical protein